MSCSNALCTRCSKTSSLRTLPLIESFEVRIYALLANTLSCVGQPVPAPILRFKVVDAAGSVAVYRGCLSSSMSAAPPVLLK